MSKSELLTVTLGEHHGAIVVAAKGEIDMGTAPVLREGLDAAVVRAGAEPMIVVDLLEVGFLASAGLALLVEYNSRCQDLGGVLRVLSTGGPATRAIEVTALDRVLAVFPSLAAITAQRAESH
ncbi:MAG: STAS domain-containing protein [Actinomycetota bacterium]|nr:STAS domain-containing protein [Actinomycetota bacterium]